MILHILRLKVWICDKGKTTIGKHFPYSFKCGTKSVSFNKN